MLDSFRRHATGWVAKLLFGILILSFAIWGIGDIFLGPRGGDGIAEVAGTTITAREVTNEFESRWRELQPQLGGNFDRRAAVSLGLLHQALEAAIARRLVDAHGRDLDLTVADETLAELIRRDPSFQGSGGFDRERFELILRSSGMSEQDYVAALRADLVRSRLIESIAGPVTAPETLTRKLLAWQGEQRRGRALLVRAADIKVEAPDEAALAAFLKEHAKDYEAPEYRSAVLLVLRPEDLLAEIEVPPADIQAAYDSRIDQYRRPAQRRLEQLLAPDEATIRRAAELVAAGQSFAAAAEALKAQGVERSELGPLAKGDLPKELDEAAWSLAGGAVGAPVASPFGWHLLRVVEAKPEETQPLAAVQDEIRRELALERAAERLPDLATRLEDELAGGATVEAAAGALGLEVLRLERIDRTGHDAEGERLAADRLTPEILQAIFAAAQGETSLLEQTQDGRYYLFRIDAVEPAHERPLAEVRDAVTAAWQASEQKKRAHAKAEELRARATGTPGALEELARSEPGTAVIGVGPVRRDDNGLLAGLNQEAIRALFATPPGAVADQVVDVPAGAVVLVTDEVLPAAENAAAEGALEAGVRNTLRAELLQAYEAALRQRYPVSIDQAALAQLMEAQAQ